MPKAGRKREIAEGGGEDGGREKGKGKGKEEAVGGARPRAGVRVGVHVSITGSIDKAVDRAKERGCDTFQIFTRNPRGWRYTDLKAEEVEGFRRKVEEYGITPPVAHMPYLPNIASPKDDLYEQSVRSLIADLERSGALGIPYLVVHLGSHLGQGAEVGFQRIIEACNRALGAVDNEVMLLLENTAGQKNSVGSSFEELRYILDHIEQRDRVGVCFDTCHAFAAGYDLRSEEAVKETLSKFDRAVGFRHLKVVHLNDSVGELGSGLDRHEHIGLGHIGEGGFRSLLKWEAIRGLPLILETPLDERRDDKGNIAKVRELAS